MLEPRTRLSADDLRAVADLERRVVAHDGGRLKLEWEDLRSRDGARTNDLLWVEAGRVVGFAAFDAHGGPAVEIAGMVDPAARGRGIGTAMLSAALEVCRARQVEQALLIVPRASEAGAHLARKVGAELEHSEHALRLDAGPEPGREDPRTTLRRAVAADVPALTQVLAAAFGHEPGHLLQNLEATRTLVIEHDGEPAGTVRLTRDGDVGGVYGFAVDPRFQGCGIGRDVLRRSCSEFFAEGATSVRLEVAVDNPRALGLYTSVGFVPVTTEDYYDLPLG